MSLQRQPAYEPPWPAATPVPTASTSQQARLPNKRRKPAAALLPRQTADPADVLQALINCQVFSGNEIVSCFPTSNTIIPQHQYVNFIWNSRRPEITNSGNGNVDVYLLHGDSLRPFLSWQDTPNPFGVSGRLATQVNDTWFGDNGLAWNGNNISYTYYFVLMPQGQALNSDLSPQATFTAVQTTYLDSVASSISSISASSVAAAASISSLSVASLSSLSFAASASSLALTPGSPSGSEGGVQNPNNGSNFPHWAIAVITVLGFLAILAGCILAFIIMRRLRRREESNKRDSLRSSQAPMMGVTHRDSPNSPLLGGVAGVAGHRTSSHLGHSVNADAASQHSHGTGEAGPFSSADAAIMADAFRKALRKPEFGKGTTPEEGDSPSQQEENDLMNQQLAEDGQDLRRVDSSREVNVQRRGDT